MSHKSNDPLGLSITLRFICRARCGCNLRQCPCKCVSSHVLTSDLLFVFYCDHIRGSTWKNPFYLSQLHTKFRQLLSGLYPPCSVVPCIVLFACASSLVQAVNVSKELEWCQCTTARVSHPSHLPWVLFSVTLLAIFVGVARVVAIARRAFVSYVGSSGAGPTTR